MNRKLLGLLSGLACLAVAATACAQNEAPEETAAQETTTVAITESTDSEVKTEVIPEMTEVPTETATEAQTQAITTESSETLAEMPAETSPETATEALTDSVTEAASEAVTDIPVETETEAITEEDTAVQVNYEKIQNPIENTGSDPWVVEHEGSYYYCFARGNGVAVSEASSIHEISQRKGAMVYTAPEGTAYSYNYWAPELHYIDGEWYIYVAADNGNNENHRMYVLKGTSQSPLDPFEMVGQITDPSNKWAIDGSILRLNGELYFIWSGWEGDEDGMQNIYIAHMSDPCTIDSERVLLSSPTYDWETVEWPDVNEGPTALQHGDDTFIVYSASGSWNDYYCLGMLTLTGDDPMNPDHWEKERKPVFSRRANVAYGPGHSSFATAHDGSVWMIYHANLESGTGWYGRSLWIAPITFDEDGEPDFGRPKLEVKFPVPVKSEP